MMSKVSITVPVGYITWRLGKDLGNLAPRGGNDVGAANSVTAAANHCTAIMLNEQGRPGLATSYIKCYSKLLLGHDTASIGL